MGDLLSPTAVAHPPPSPTRSSLPMLYYGLVVIATTAIVLVLYNLLVIKWCTDHRASGPASFRSSGVSSVSSFKYKSDGGGGGGSECVVCLSVFEEGEQVKKLPKCRHCFHAACIDMWLYSHLDCPLCRSPVEPGPVAQEATTGPQQHAIVVQSEHSREILLGTAIFA